MTRKFTTPCYVRIEDAGKRKEVCEELVSLEYYVGQAYIDALDEVIVTYPESGTFCTGSEGQFDEIDLNGCLDCGTNAEMFLALAGMREDTDANQFYKKGNYIYKADEQGNLTIPFVHYHSSFPTTRATAAEIIEHFEKGNEAISTDVVNPHEV